MKGLIARAPRSTLSGGDEWDGRLDASGGRHHPWRGEPDRRSSTAERHGGPCVLRRQRPPWATDPACGRLPPRRPRLLHSAHRRPVVARLVGPPLLDALLRMWRSGTGGLVHGLAGLGDRPSAQRLLLGGRERAARRQPALEHLRTVDRSPPGSGHLDLRSRCRHQRRAHARPGAECVGLFRRGPPSDQLEAGRHSGSAGLRLLVRHRHVDRLRPRVRHRVGDPTVPLHLAARDRDPPGALGPSATGSSWRRSSSCSSSYRPRSW